MALKRAESEKLQMKEDAEELEREAERDAKIETKKQLALMKKSSVVEEPESGPNVSELKFREPHSGKTFTR